MSDLRRAAEELIPILDKWKMTYPPCSGADWDKVEALRQALAQEKEIEVWGKPLVELREAFKEAESLAQQGKECVYPECETGIGCDGPCGEKPVDTVNTSKERETTKRGHEPVAYRYKDEHGFWRLAPVPTIGSEPVYTAPPKREWVDLTKDEIHSIGERVANEQLLGTVPGFRERFAQAISIALREKNT